MEVFCGKCGRVVGRVDDGKIVPGKRVTVACPVCGEKILLASGEEKGREAAAPPPPRESDSAPSGGEGSGGFTVGGVISEAWRRTRGLKGPVWGAYLILLAAMAVLNALAGGVAGLLGTGPAAIGFAVAGQLTISLLSYPFLAGIMMMGVYRAVDRPVSYQMAFDFFGRALPLIMATLLVSLVTMVGFVFLIIPGIYLTVAYLLVLPLIIDKGMGVWEAMETSRRGITRHWFKVFFIYFVLGIILFLSAIPLGIGLIWTMPMLIAAGGIIYREIFGVRGPAA